MHCMVDVAAQGGATAGDFVKNINELWIRSPVEMGADKFLMRVAVLSWTCNDVATWNTGKSGRFKAKQVTPEMRQAAEQLRRSLERYPVGIIIGPGLSTQWNLEEGWTTGSDELLDILKPAHFHCWASNNLWSAMERAEDGWHGAAHAANEQLVARHIARAIDYIVSAHYLLKAFQAFGMDGDRYGDPHLEERVSEPELLAKMAVDWEGLQLSAVEPTEQAMAQVQAEKKVAVAKELREDRPETKGIALLRSAIAPAQAEAAAEPEEGYQEKQAADLWYANNAWIDGFVGRGTAPPVTKDAVWTAVTELFDRKRWIEPREWNAIQSASRFYGRMLRHGENDAWAPDVDEDGSMSSELAFNVGIVCGKMNKKQLPSDLYTCFKLQQKDINRARFHVLVRDPTTVEINDVNARKYMINVGPLGGKLLLRIRTVQGHSGVRATQMTRVNQRLVPKVEYPALLMHSTNVALLQSISLRGLIPGGLTRQRVDVFMANALEFSHKVYFDKPFAPRVWKDPVHDVHMRKESDVVVFIPGTLLCQIEDFVLFHSSDTGDYVTPCTIPAKCIVSARRRDDGDLEHENPESLHRSALNEYPAEYWFAMGRDAADKEPVPPLPPPAAEPSPEKEPSPPPQKARGSADPMTPRDGSSRATGAGTPRIVLQEAPRHATEKSVDKPQPKTPPVPPKRVAEPDAPVKDKRRNKIPSEPRDEQEEEDTFQPDWSRDESKTFKDADDVFTVKEEKLIDGQRQITERKARFCKFCQTEVVATLKTCPNCAERADGTPNKSTADSVGAVARILKPTISKWLDRGGRSAAGNMRDDYKRTHIRQRAGQIPAR